MDSLENKGKQEIKELQKTAILKDALILRKVLLLKVQNIEHGK